MFLSVFLFFFFFKQKTAYEMRISDWSSDVCSSDLTDARQVTTGFLDGADIVCDPEGNFTIQIGGEQRSGNWLRLEPESNTVMLRETFAVRAEETPVRDRKSTRLNSSH